MKLITITALLIMSFTHFTLAQAGVDIPTNNAMSNAVGLSAEFGVTLGFTDYSTSVMNYTGKGSIEYFFPSTGSGNFGIRVFGQTGFIGGKGAPAGSLNPTDEFATKMNWYGGGIVYILSLGEAVYPWASIGASQLWYFPKDGNKNLLPNYAAGTYKKYTLAYNGDAGVRIMVSQHMSVNINAGIVVSTKDFLDDFETGGNNDMFYTATAGLTYYLGRDKDSDGDGVPDSRDMCPDTPLGVQVDEFGCPIDTDGDGVPDYLDKCPNTPRNVAVDRNGCPIDSDGDGVPDYLDKCPNTPTGVKVDASGCPIDSDGDGVPDYLDKCPNTPKGVTVDAKGCPIDSDGDGVPDYLDKCPNTPKGTKVDADGCPIKEVVEHTTLSGDTNFEFDKSSLLSNAYTTLDNLALSMKENPGYKWEIAGYTDGIGSAQYNVTLSRQRAQSVVDYLVRKGVDRNNLKIVGYGKDNPVATNDTPEGRAMNRRVEIKLLSK